ncbi:MAG: efflux RND transporter permease subunit [Gammaproteobacteria bacterium]
MLRKLLTHHPLVNILFAVVLIFGALSFTEMPRENDPDVNFNWVIVNTVLPGASAKDVEDLITSPLEDALNGVKDVRFVSSNSQQSSSSMLVRFNDIPRDEFLLRFADLRRDLQNKARSELPDEAEDPFILELTTSSGFPTAIVVVTGQANDEKLREISRSMKQDIERLKGVDRVTTQGLHPPELQVNLNLSAMAARGLNAVDVSDSIRSAYRDTSAGEISVAGAAWLVRVDEAEPDPEKLAQFQLRTPDGGQVALGQIASIERVRQKASTKVATNGSPAVSLAVIKQKYVNTLDLIDRVNEYVDEKNVQYKELGISVVLADDQTVQTRTALNIMGRNAVLGLFLVLVVCWLFLGIRIAAMVTLGIAFSIAGTLWVLNVTGNTLNVMVLLGIVIVLGMLVDDAVVVVEAIYYRLQRGVTGVDAAVDALAEVGKPVLSAVATTMAAFLPLMLLGGIVGQFMFVIPFVVSTGLAVSLVEAFWILPAHVISLGTNAAGGVTDRNNWRVRWTAALRKRYIRSLIYFMRRPFILVLATIALIALAVLSIYGGRVTLNFFQADPLRIFYVNVDMPPDASLDQTLAQAQVVEQRVREKIDLVEVRAITTFAGIKFTETEAFLGDQYGQIQVSLNPRGEGRTVGEIVDGLREFALKTPGDGQITFTQLSGGPPVLGDINVKVRSNDYEELRAAADSMKKLVATIPGSSNIADDDVPGRLELTLDLDETAIRRAGLEPGMISRLVRLHVDGEVISFLRYKGEKMELRVRAAPRQVASIEEVLDEPIALPGGGTSSLRELSTSKIERGSGIIRHYNFRRSITVSADIDETQIDVKKANELLKEKWNEAEKEFATADADYSGVLDDITESLDGMKVLFMFGLGLMYLILATQFKSYFQPFLILTTVPMAFTGVVLGLSITGNPLSLFSMYGVIALTGIAVNSAIVLIDAANQRIASGMRPLHATVYAAKRRVVPVLMTATTTIAGLFSLAVGLGGKSLVWGPVASSIVSGLVVATALTLFVVPILYRCIMHGSIKRRTKRLNKIARQSMDSLS